MSNVHEQRSTILLVEDSLDEELLFLRAVQQAALPCGIAVAHSTEEALDYLFTRNAFAGREPGNPDVIFTDLRIGALGGAAFISELRSHESTRLIPIVVLTGSANPVQIEDLYKRGANSFLEKPIDFQEYADAITALARYWALLNKSPTHQKHRGSYPYPL